MYRVTAIRHSGDWDTSRAADRVVLDADERQRRRIVLTGEKGTKVLLDLERPVHLRDGDGLVLDDGTILRVCGRPEPLVEIEASSPAEFGRLAWHLGNRHTDVQIVGERLRIRRDHVLEEMLKGLGAKVTPVEAPFDPEAGAYGHAQPSHAHAHAPGHGHRHGHDHHHHHDHDHAHTHGGDECHGHGHGHGKKA